MPATMAALIVSRLKGGWRRFMNSCSWPLESVRTEYVMSGDGMPCIMPPRPSEPWHMAHPTPAMPWLFSTTRPPEVVPCRKLRLVGPLHAQKSSAPAAAGPDVVQPIIHLRKGPRVLIEVAPHDRIEVVRKRDSGFRAVEMRRLSLHDRIIQRHGVEQVSPHRH